jgi:hypothetical protein
MKEIFSLPGKTYTIEDVEKWRDATIHFISQRWVIAQGTWYLVREYENPFGKYNVYFPRGDLENPLSPVQAPP